MADLGLDPQQLSALFKGANDAASQAYYNSKLGGEAEDRALARAKFQWQQTLDRAGLTGMFEGSPTLEAMQSYADMFGDWSTPQAGQKTLAAQKQAYDIASGEAGMLGTYQGQQTQAAAKQAADIANAQAAQTGWLNNQGGVPGQGTQTLAGQQQGWSQGFQQQQEQNKQVQNYLQMIGALRGPADYGQYLKVLGSTPGGLQGLVGAAAGQYAPATGASYGQPVPVSLGSFMNSGATGQSQQYQPGQYAYPQAQTAQREVSATPYQQAQNVQQTQLGQQPQSTDYNAYMAAAQGLPPPNQISPQAYNALTTTGKQMMGGMYEQLGWNPQDVTDLYKQSLPKYGSSGPQTGGFKIQ